MQKQIKLVERLLERSRDGALDWQQTAVDGLYQVSFSSSTVRISEEGRFGASDNDYVLEIVNEQGQVVENFNDRDLDTADTGIIGGDNFKKMREILFIAKRKALGSDKALTDVLSELDKL